MRRVPCLALAAVVLLTASGCLFSRERKAAKALVPLPSELPELHDPEYPLPPPRERPEPVTVPLIGDDVKIASPEVREGLKPFFSLGAVLLAVGVLGGLLLRSVKVAAVSVLAGGASAMIAVWLAEFPRSTLLIPVGLAAAGVPFLLAWVVAMYRALKVIVRVIDEVPEGKKIKAKLKETPSLAATVRKGIEWFKAKLRGKTGA